MELVILVLGISILVVSYSFMKDMRFYLFCKSSVCKDILIQTNRIEEAVKRVEEHLKKELNFFESQLLEIFFYEHKLRE
jgi:hypothetical protein